VIAQVGRRQPDLPCRQFHQLPVPALDLASRRAAPFDSTKKPTAALPFQPRLDLCLDAEQPFGEPYVNAMAALGFDRIRRLVRGPCRVGTS